MRERGKPMKKISKREQRLKEQEALAKRAIAVLKKHAIKHARNGGYGARGLSIRKLTSALGKGEGAWLEQLAFESDLKKALSIASRLGMVDYSGGMRPAAFYKGPEVEEACKEFEREQVEKASKFKRQAKAMGCPSAHESGWKGDDVRMSRNDFDKLAKKLGALE